MLVSSVFSIGTKAVQAIASFATVHKLVKMWGLSGYGLWVTLTAFALYISLFDMGVGYGVKNRISEAWGRGEPDQAAGVVRVGVAVYFVAALAALLCGFFVVMFVTPFKDHKLASGVLWVACVVSFFLSIHNTVLQGLARFKVLAALGLLAPCTWFAILQLWPSGTALTLETGAAIYAAAIVIQAIVIVVVSRRVHDFRIGAWYRTPLQTAKPLIRTGAGFLILQLAAFALYGSGSLLVYRSLGGLQTAQYDAASKVFSIFTIAFSTLISIAWTEISRAKAAHDRKRLANVRRLLHIAALAFLAAATLACAFSAPLTKALTGIRVPTSATISFVVFVGVQMLAFTSAVFLNAYERLREQIITAMISIPLFFAIAFGLLSLGWGMPAIPTASAAAMLPSLVVCYLIARGLVKSSGHEQELPLPVNGGDSTRRTP